MAIGRIISTPIIGNAYGVVRSEHGQEFTVHASEFQDDSRDGYDFPYRVDIWQHAGRNAATLRHGDPMLVDD